MVEYNDIERQALAMMQRTDFKNLSKTDVVSIFSQLSQLRPEVASQVIAQFPEFVNLVQSSLAEYKAILGEVISSDDAYQPFAVIAVLALLLEILLRITIFRRIRVFFILLTRFFFSHCIIWQSDDTMFPPIKQQSEERS